MLRVRSATRLKLLTRCFSHHAAPSSAAGGKQREISPDEQLSTGLSLISQGVLQVAQALLKYRNSPSSARTTLSKLPEFRQPNANPVDQICIVFEGLRQFIQAAIEYKLSEDLKKTRTYEPPKPNEIFIRKQQHEKVRPTRGENFETIDAKDPPTLGSESKAKKVPSSRLGRAFTYGNLFAGLSLGTASEAIRRVVSNDPNSSLILSEANANRIVETLCQVRGAALKIGQILSIQDTSLVPEQIQSLFVRVRDSAHYMPKWQLNRVMSREWGNNWRDKLDSFEEMPFAAASIGQVHRAEASGRKVAIKIQYPGVAQGINSDIDNLMMMLKIWDILPKGMFIKNLVEVARRELAWEVDYHREASAAIKFKELLKEEEVFYVPDIISELSTERVLVSELITEAIPVDRLENASQGLRNFVAENLLRLTLNEIFVYRYMQTDPNWSNFLYQPRSQKIILLDFGASRPYRKAFIDIYIKIIDAAIGRDEATIIALSKKIGFLTGDENELMRKAHCDATLILAEAFTVDEFDFSRRETERKVSQLVPIMLKHRLTPPPEEIYSLHRKLSGIFLLCSKLRAKINCRKLFRQVHDEYRFDGDEDVSSDASS